MENPNELFQNLFAETHAIAAQRPLLISRESHQTGGELRQFLPEHRAHRLRVSQVRARKQSAEVLIADARFHQDRQNRSIFHRQLTANDRPESMLLACGKESGCPIDAIAVAECHGGHSHLGTGLGKMLRLGGTA